MTLHTNGQHRAKDTKKDVKIGPKIDPKLKLLLLSFPGCGCVLWNPRPKAEMDLLQKLLLDFL